MRISVLFLFLLSCCFTYQLSWSQGENMNWHYGKNVSVNFAQNPLVVNTSQLYTLEGCATVSDANGDLLFYTTGFKIWNKNGVEMPNATGLQGNGPLQPGQTLPAGSGYKSVQIIKHPGNPNQYFVVSGDPQELAVKKLYYHVVDMSLNAGLGDVVSGQKNIEIMSNVSEHLSVFSGTDCKSYWLIAATHGYSGQYYAFKIDATGFHNTPVINTLPINFQGYKELFQAKDLHTAIGVTGTHLFTLQFDGINGTLTNFDTVSTVMGAPQYYNCAPGMSKDKSKFYFGNSSVSNLYQVDLNLLPNLSAVVNSRVEIIPPRPTFSFIYHLRAAPVGDKIYLIQSVYNSGSSQYISTLNNASQPAAQVVYTQDALPLFPPNFFSTSYYYTLGTDVVINPPSDTVFNRASDTLLCNRESYQLNCPNADAGQFLWSTGATSSGINVTQSGTYWVRSSNVCQMVYDTFHVSFVNPELTLPADTQLCAGKSLVIDAIAPGAETYLWNTGATDSRITVTEPGTYYVEVSQQGCKVSDTIHIEGLNAYVTILQNDTLICNNMPITVNATSNLESTFRWNDGTTGPVLNPSTSGQYIVTATNRCGDFSKSVNIEVVDCVCWAKVPDAFSPNGDGINDALRPMVAPGCNIQAFNFRIYNRYGQLVFTGIRPGQGWDGYFNGRPAENGTYMYQLEYTDIYSGKSTRTKGDITLLR